MKELTPYEKQLAAALLEIASSTFANHGCNDFDLSKYVPRDYIAEINKNALQYTGDDPDRYDEVSLLNAYFTEDHVLMSWLAQKLKASALNQPEGRLESAESPTLRCVLRVWLTSISIPVDWEIPISQREKVRHAVKLAHQEEVATMVPGINSDELYIDGKHIASFAIIFLP